MASISGVLNFFKNNGSRIISSGIGLAALGCVTYDSHYIGKMQAYIYASERDAQRTAYYLNNDMYSPGMSKVSEKVRHKSYTMELDQGWRRFFNAGIGYVKGFFSMLISNVIPLALGIGALTKGAKGKICAAGLVAYGAFKFVKNFFGLGTPRGLQK